jgi:membrane protein DedA with SNARE-associated domain
MANESHPAQIEAGSLQVPSCAGCRVSGSAAPWIFQKWKEARQSPVSRISVMENWIQTWIGHFGYIGVLILMILENLFPPLPSELIMPMAGYVAQQGKLNFWGVVAAGAIGSCAGQIPLYYLGRYLGAARLRRWVERFPWLAISPAEFDKADAWFSRHGSKTVFFCRLIPGLRSLISVPAGIYGMNINRFLLYTAGGTVTWTLLLAWAGWSLGASNSAVERFIHPISWFVMATVAAVYVVRMVKRLREQRLQPQRSRSHQTTPTRTFETE